MPTAFELYNSLQNPTTPPEEAPTPSATELYEHLSSQTETAEPSLWEKLKSGGAKVMSGVETAEKALVLPHLIRGSVTEALKRADTGVSALWNRLPDVQSQGVVPAAKGYASDIVRGLIHGNVPLPAESLEKKWGMPFSDSWIGDAAKLGLNLTLSPSTYLPIGGTLAALERNMIAKTGSSLPAKLGALTTERAQAKADLAKLLSTKKEAPDALAQRLALEQKISTIEDEIAVDFPKLATQADPVQALGLLNKAGAADMGGLKAAHAERVISDHAAGLITEAEAVKELKALAKGIISPTSYISDISKSTGKAVSARPSSPGKAAKVMSYQVAKDLAQYGYKVDKPTFASSLLRNTERWDAVDLKFGTDMSSLPLKTSAATSKSTNFLADFAKEMKGIEKDIARLNMDDDLVRMALKGEVVLPPEETAVVDRLRALTAKAREVGIANGRDIGFLENYAPDRLKAGLSVGAPKALNKKAVAPTEQKMTAEYHKRGKLNEDLMEKSPVTAAKMYASDIARTFYDGVMPDIQKNWSHLQLLGQDKEAAYLLQTFANTTGMGRPAAVRLIASHFLKNGSFDVESALKAADIKMSTDTIDKILNTAGELMMENWIGPNIKTHVLQRMQNYLVGSAEIGFKYVKRGSKLFKNTPEKLKPVLERARRDLQVIDDVDLLERGLGGESYKLPLGLETVRKPGKWLLSKFAAVETPNRLKMFLGARQQFVENLDKMDDVLGGMLETQRRSVLAALEKGGIEEAAYQYGLIRSTRTNFLFSAMDRPEILSGKLGRLIPFTSWTTNNWMRYLGDVKQGDYRTLTKRIVYPMAILAIIQGTTGFKMPGGHPASGLTSLPEIAPFATDPTALVPGAGIYQRGKKLFGKKPTTAGGFHPVEHPSLQSLIVDFVKKSKKESK